MDKAIINNKIVSAYEISLDYEEEKRVRNCSRNKQIRCLDAHCQNPILRYCHGDKKEAYFAHLTNTQCDYDKFDKKDNSILKELRIKLFNIFTTLGYTALTEHKLLKHHYSPIFCTKDDESFVVEMGDSRTTLKYVEKLQNEYTSKQIPVKWIVVGEETMFYNENKVSFLKRYLLNESNNHDFILVDGEIVIQYRLDKKKYGLSICRDIYEERAEIQKICVVDGELTIDGFDLRFKQWQKKKEEHVAQEIERRKEERAREQRRKELEQSQKLVEHQVDKTKTSSPQAHDYYSRNYEIEETIFTCTTCGKRGTEEEFYFMEGNKGECYECLYGPERWAEIKKNRGYQEKSKRAKTQKQKELIPQRKSTKKPPIWWFLFLFWGI